MDTKLLELRKKIDGIDAQILTLLSDRMGVVLLVGELKREEGRDFLDQGRWQEVLESKRLQAKNLRLDEEFVMQVYELIHQYALRLEKEGRR